MPSRATSVILFLMIACVRVVAPLYAQGADSISTDARLLAVRADSVRQHRPASEYGQAVALWAKAAALYERVGQPRETARLLDSAGMAYYFAGRIDSASAYVRSALRISGSVGDRDGEARALRQLSAFFGTVGHPDSALRYLRHALAVWRKSGNRAGEANALNNIAAVYFGLGRPDSALINYEEALDLSRAAGHREGEGEALNGIGKVDRSHGRLDSASVRFHQALAIWQELGMRKAEGGVLNNIALVLDAKDRPDSALIYYRRALDVSRQTREAGSEGYALNGIARVHRRLGRPDSAFFYHQWALSVRRAIRNRTTEGETLAEIGSLYLHHPSASERDPARAAAYLDSAAALFAQIHREAGSDANSVSFAELTRHAFSDWALAWLARGEDGEMSAAVAARGALAAAERGRAQALLELMLRSTLAASPIEVRERAMANAGDDLVAEGDSLLARLGRGRTAALSYLVTADALLIFFTSPSGAMRVERVAIARDSLASLVREVRVELERESAPYIATRRGSRVSARTLLATMETDATLLPVRAARGPEPARPVGGSARMLSRIAAIVLPEDLRELMQRELGDTGDLVVVPNGSLFLLPFGALPTGRSGEALGLTYALRFAPSLGALHAAESRPKRLPAPQGARMMDRAVIVGDPTMPVLPGSPSGEVLEVLPSARREARWLAKRVGGTALLGPAATETEVVSRLPTALLIHFATHGFTYSADERARDSFVALAPDPASDGLLTVGELLDDPSLALEAELVVLSACQTGLGNLRDAEGMVGQQRAFLARGARSVLVSLWSVSDEATELLMQRFYTHWLGAGALSKSEALRRAQRDVRETRGFEHPMYWAAFQLVGAR